MQREIKFRVYDNINKEWLLGYKECGGFSINGVLMLMGKWQAILNKMLKGQFGEDGKELFVQQYTGLKDKNGVDIYEGDVLKCKGFDGWFDTVGFYYNVTVKYNTVESGDSHIAGFAYIPMDREVIGNIFENSELLK